jgi:menaquinone-dependent protoporphyrinogen oxidase
LNYQGAARAIDAQVVTASRHGSTTEIGSAIARTLADAGLNVRTRDAEDDEVLAESAALVLGSPLYMGKWLGPARAIADRLAADASETRTWFFTVGPLGNPPQPADASPEDDLAELIERVGEGHVMFTGKLDRSQLKLRERVAVNAVKAPDGDFRDWDAIRRWAESIASALKR